MGLSGRSIICPKRRPDAGQRLFCFPHAGVGPSVFRGWADQFATDAEVCLVQLPGREGRLRESPFESIANLMPALLADMRPLLDRPFAFYGHSLGATVAFECARNLRRALRLQPEAHFCRGQPGSAVALESLAHALLAGGPVPERNGETLRRIAARSYF